MRCGHVRTKGSIMAFSKQAVVKYPDISAKPHQPVRLAFPKRDYGKQAVERRCCQSPWFKRWPWLHYREDNDCVFCHTLEATTSFRLHVASACHKEAVERVFTLPATTRDVREALSAAHALEKTENRQCLLKILSNLRFLARQSCAIRGDGDESDSNFVQLFKLRGEDDPKIHEWTIRRTNKYTSDEVQNDMLKVMAMKVLRNIAACLHDSSSFMIMTDKTTDVSNREQVTRSEVDGRH